MEITNTIVTRSAVQKTDIASYMAEYVEENGKLLRAHCNIYSPTDDPEGPGNYIGSVYLENRMVSCSIPHSELVSEYFQAVTEMFETILETIPLTDEESKEPATK